MLTILGKRSSINVRKVLWTCEEAGLAYQQEDYGSGFKPLDTPEFQRLNPNSLVPVLLDDDFVLWVRRSVRGGPLPLHDVCIFLYSKIESITHRNSDIYNPVTCHLNG